MGNAHSMVRWIMLLALLPACNARVPVETNKTPQGQPSQATSTAPPVEEDARHEPTLPGKTGETGATGPTASTGQTIIEPPATLTHYLTGNDKNSLVTLGDPALILMGGGSDVDAVFTWAATKVPNGDVVILRASGADGYNDYLYTEIGGFDSVETLLVTTRALADDPYVADRIAQAELIFIAGGDQSVYTAQWRGTKLTNAVASAYQRGAIVGGTSAGAMVLSDPIYTGEKGSALSNDVLQDPFAEEVTLAPAVFSLLRGALVDTHFTQRDRLGRLVVFLARAYNTPLFGIGIDEKTALVLDASGNATVFGTNKVHVLYAGHSPEILNANDPLTYRHVPKQSFAPGATLTLSEALLLGEVDCVAGEL